MRLSYTTLHEQIKTVDQKAWRLKDYNLYYNLNISDDSLKYKSEILSVKLKNNLTRLKDYYIRKSKNDYGRTFGLGTSLRKDKADMIQ